MRTLNWKDEYKKEFCNYVLTIDTDIPFATPIKILEWLEPTIEDLLKTQREKYYYEIENSTGTKEADYIDKQVNGGS